MGYAQDWDSTDQIALRAVETGRVDRLGTLDATNGGTTGRYTLAGTYQTTTASAAQTRVQAYAAYYHLDLFSNFTYFLDDPDQGDQFEQADQRLYAGGGVSHRWLAPSLGQGAVNTVGADLRHDQILGVGLFRTQNRERIGTVRDDEVAESSVGAYGATRRAGPTGSARRPACVPTCTGSTWRATSTSTRASRPTPS